MEHIIYNALSNGTYSKTDRLIRIEIQLHTIDIGKVIKNNSTKVNTF